MKKGDLVWCVYCDYRLPLRGIILKIHELSLIHNDSEFNYEVLIGDEIHTLSELEVYKTELEALDYQMEMLRGMLGYKIT